MSITEPTVHVIDDDPAFGDVVRVMLGNAGLRVVVYTSAEKFLDGYSGTPKAPRCLLLDMRLRGMSGMALLEDLVARHVRIPVIFLTGYGDVGTAVAAMKAGALDVLEKPPHRQMLLERVRQALDRDARHERHRTQHVDVRHRLGLLSQREREVMEELVAGQNSKQIATKLGIAPKTAMKHRSRVLEKLAVDSVVQLVRLLSQSADHDGPELGASVRA